MQGTYDPSHVVLSLVIAMLAGFVALEFAGRLFARRDEARRAWLPWLAGGALAMGSGIWSMHFIGMAALSLPLAISYDLGLTAVSWLAAVAVSALALGIVARREVTTSTVLLGATAMGAGICAMHYLGMGAMRLQPGIDYDPTWLGLSALIAVGASAAALRIAVALRVVRTWRDVGLRALAALALGLGMAGMHYAGMAAANFPNGAVCSASNALHGHWMTLPVAVGAVLSLAFAVLFSASDARAVLRAQREARSRDWRVTQLAFNDGETGLPNRARLSQMLSDALHAGATPTSVIGIRLRRLAGAPDPDMPGVATALRHALPSDWILARTSADQFTVMAACAAAGEVALRARASWAEAVARLQQRGLALEFNLAECPRDGTTAQMLLFRAGTSGVALDQLERAQAQPASAGGVLTAPA